MNTVNKTYFLGMALCLLLFACALTPEAARAQQQQAQRGISHHTRRPLQYRNGVHARILGAHQRQHHGHRSCHALLNGHQQLWRASANRRLH